MNNAQIVQTIPPMSKNEYIALELTKCWINRSKNYVSVSEMVNVYDETLRKLYAKENNND